MLCYVMLYYVMLCYVHNLSIKNQTENIECRETIIITLDLYSLDFSTVIINSLLLVSATVAMFNLTQVTKYGISRYYEWISMVKYTRLATAVIWNWYYDYYDYDCANIEMKNDFIKNIVKSLALMHAQRLNCNEVYWNSIWWCHFKKTILNQMTQFYECYKWFMKSLIMIYSLVHNLILFHLVNETWGFCQIIIIIIIIYYH